MVPARVTPRIETHYTDEEIDAIMRALIPIINAPMSTTDPAPKRPLIDFFGLPKAGKSKTTEKLDRFFRRRGLNVNIPPESAEYATIRSRSQDIPFAFQLTHLTIAITQALTGAWTRDHNVTITSRGLIDMLVWFRDGANTGLYTSTQEQRVREFIYEYLRMDSVDAFFYFYCDPHVAMEREYGKSATKTLGSKMNPDFLTRIHDVYEAVLSDVEREIPGLPIVRMDTSNFKDEAETERATLVHLLPLLQKRFNVPRSKVLPRSPSLMRREAFSKAGFEEQIKLRGHPSQELVSRAGWKPIDTVTQVDVYLNPEPELEAGDRRFATIVRIREESGELRLLYKSEANDSIFSHRRSTQVTIEADDAHEIREKFPEIATVKKSRMRYRLDRDPSKSEGHFFTLHVDSTDIGEFTEIRARGTESRTHEEELLELAAELGFSPADIIRGSYLGHAMRERSE